MSIRLVASDMDGTLLDPYSNISKANIDAILRLSGHGAQFLICSGRDYHDAKTMMDACGISCAFICLSGAAIYDVDGSMIQEITLTPDNLSDISRVFDSCGAPMDILTSEGRYTTATREEKLKDLYDFYNAHAPLPDPVPQNIHEAAEEHLSATNFIRTLDDIPLGTKIYKICGNNLSEELAAALKVKFAAYPDIAAASSFPTNIELTNTAAQKGLALKVYSQLKGISLEDVMVLGDSDNDLSMFTPQFGWTVAMENSMECISSAAKYHTKSNAEDGVAWAIRTYVLQET